MVDLAKPDAPGEPCSCTEEAAQELHELVAALGASHGIDLCDPGGPSGDDDLTHALELIHDLSLAQGAECPAPDDDDLDEDPQDIADDTTDAAPTSRFRPR